MCESRYLSRYFTFRCTSKPTTIDIYINVACKLLHKLLCTPLINGPYCTYKGSLNCQSLWDTAIATIHFFTEAFVNYYNYEQFVLNNIVVEKNNIYHPLYFIQLSIHNETLFYLRSKWYLTRWTYLFKVEKI